MQFSLSSNRLRALHCFIWCSMLAISAARAAPPRIIIAYPPDNKIVAFDHVLLSGSVAKGATLKIDNRVLDVAPDGLFIEWWPLKPGENMIVLESVLGGETTKRELRVNSEMPRPPRLTFPINRDDATSGSDMTFYVASSLWNQGVNVSFRTMSGGQATYSIGSRGPFLMTESQTQPGLYTASYAVRDDDIFDNAPVTFQIAINTPDGEKYTSRVTAKGTITVSADKQPRVGIITAEPIGLGVNASTTAIRNGPKRSHILQLQRDTKFIVIGEDGDTFRCALSPTQTVNVLKTQMQLLPIGTTLPRVYFSRIETRKVALTAAQNATSSTRSARDSVAQNTSTPSTSIPIATTQNSDARATSSTRSSQNVQSQSIQSRSAQHNATQIRFDLPSRVPFQIEQIADDNAQILNVRLFNTESDVDYLVSTFPDELVRSVTWRQESDGVFLSRIVLKTQQQWGFFAVYENNTLVLTVKGAPKLSRRKPLAGLRVLVDAGHGGTESGAPGALGVDEKDLNLRIALLLAEKLKRRGADVILSRNKDVTVPLYDRALLAEKTRADILISVHGNALPDGVDPRTQRGAGVYYFQPQSRALAETLQAALLRDLPEVGNDGLHYQNLALTRPSTQLSILVETAFLTDKDNLRTLMSARGQERFAQSLARGLEEFARQIAQTSSTRKP